MIKNIDKIESLLGLEAGTLKSAIEKEDEVEITLPEIVVRTKEEDEQLQENFKREKKELYDAGKEKGVKDEINKYAEQFGIDLTDQKKDFPTFIDTLEKSLEVKLNKPKEESIKQLEQDKVKLQENLKKLENEYSAFKTEIDKKTKEQTINDTLMKSLPKEGTVIGAEELALIFKSRYQPEFLEDGKLAWKKDGEIIKDEKTMNPLPVEKIIPDFVKPYEKEATGGRGGGNGTGNPSKGSYDSFVKEMAEKGHSEGGAEFQHEMNKRVSEGTLEI